MKFKNLFVVIAFTLSVGLVLLLAQPMFGQTGTQSTRPTPLTSSIQPSSTQMAQANLLRAQATAATPTRSPAASNSVMPMNIVCNPIDHGVKEFRNGAVSYCKAEDYPQQDTDVARVDLAPGASRAPHWHPTWERQVILAGKVKTTVIDPEGNIHEGILEPGQVSFIPASYPHWSTNIGEVSATLMFVFPTGFKTFEIGQSAGQVAPDVLQQTINANIPEQIRDERRSIVPW